MHWLVGFTDASWLFFCLRMESIGFSPAGRSFIQYIALCTDISTIYQSSRPPLVKKASELIFQNVELLMENKEVKNVKIGMLSLTVSEIIDSLLSCTSSIFKIFYMIPRYQLLFIALDWFSCFVVLFVVLSHRLCVCVFFFFFL